MRKIANMVDSANPDIKRLQNEYLGIKSIHKMAAKYRVNIRYVWDLLVNGNIPTSKKICRRLGLALPEKPLSNEQVYTRKRNDGLNAIARYFGHANWSAYGTALLNTIDTQELIQFELRIEQQSKSSKTG